MSLDMRKPKNRVLKEMMEMAQALQNHDLISKHDMARMKLVCEAPVLIFVLEQWLHYTAANAYFAEISGLPCFDVFWRSSPTACSCCEG